MTQRSSSLRVSNPLFSQVLASGSLPQGALKTLKEFEVLDEKVQREFLENQQKAMELLRVLFSIVSNVKGDAMMTYHALALINGIIEDKRTRIKLLVSIQSSANKERQLDLIGILNSFLIQSHEMDQQHHRDLAAHTLAMLIEAYEYKKCAQAAKNFMIFLFEQKDIYIAQAQRVKNPKIAMLSKTAFTHCLMYMVKTNELAKDFVDRQGFQLFKALLQDDCIKNGQIAYNVCCALWILTYHPFALKGFTDFTLMIVEDVSKILDYFNKEKIVRIILMIFDVS